MIKISTMPKEDGIWQGIRTQKRYSCFWRLRQGKCYELEKLSLWPENTMDIYLCIA
jgi:Zn ribbon nucleic-acid-binding protein